MNPTFGNTSPITPQAGGNHLLVGVTVVSLALGGCTVGPDYVRPEADVNPSWLESTPALQDEPAEIREWWTAFDDPVLTRLVHEAYEQNLSLRTIEPDETRHYLSDQV
jgi:hypothetical protein